ncbi:MAG TPA: FecR family protein, partial [Terriglobales bacterium]
MSRFNFRITRMAVATLFTLLISLPAFCDSQVRIVRLSYISGSVQIDRLGRSYEKALLNLPIAEGTKLKTADDGRAEVEFEDGSTIRLAPNSVIVFPQLSLRDSGGKTSAVEVRKGTVYVNFAGTKNDELMLQFDQEKIPLAHAAHIRIAVGAIDATVAVFKGDVQIDGSSAVVAVKKNQTANFDLAENNRYTLAKNIEEQPFDAWDKQQDQHHVRYASNSYNSYSPYAYG